MFDAKALDASIRDYLHYVIDSLVEGFAMAGNDRLYDRAVHTTDPEEVADYWLRHLLEMKARRWFESEAYDCEQLRREGADDVFDPDLIDAAAELSPDELRAVCLDWAKQAKLPLVERPEVLQAYKAHQLVNTASQVVVEHAAAQFVAQGGCACGSSLSWLEFLAGQIDSYLAECRKAQRHQAAV